LTLNRIFYTPHSKPQILRPSPHQGWIPDCRGRPLHARHAARDGHIPHWFVWARQGEGRL